MSYFHGLQIVENSDTDGAASIAGPAVDRRLTIAGAPTATLVGASPLFAPVIAGGDAPYSLVVQAGALPGGRTITALTIVGSYTAAGTFAYTLRAIDAAGLVADLAVTETLVLPRPSNAIRNSANTGYVRSLSGGYSTYGAPIYA